MTGKHEHSSVSDRNIQVSETETWVSRCGWQEYTNIWQENTSTQVFLTRIHKYLTGKHEQLGVWQEYTSIWQKTRAFGCCWQIYTNNCIQVLLTSLQKYLGVAERYTQVFRCCWQVYTSIQCCWQVSQESWCFWQAYASIQVPLTGIQVSRCWRCFSRDTRVSKCPRHKSFSINVL